MEDATQFVKDIKPQLREKLIYRVYLNQKYEAKKAQGWDEVHNSIKSAPYCGHMQQISNIFFCPNCMHRAEIYRCTLCHRKSRSHYLEYPGFNKNDYDEVFIRLHPYDLSWCCNLRNSYIRTHVEGDLYAPQAAVAAFREMY